jgi:hypothetical protein
MTFTQAANRLGCTKRSIHNYIKKGFLRRIVKDGEAYLAQEDVEQLAEERGTDYPALNRKTIFQILGRLKRLEERYEIVARVWDTLGIQEQPLRPSSEDAASLHAACTAFLSMSRYELGQLETWSAVFVAFDEKTVEIIAEAVNSTQPWKPVHDLVVRMVEFLSKEKALKTSMELQALQAKLQLGRRRVREAALFWIEGGRGIVKKDVFRALDDPKEGLLRALMGKRA